MFPMVDTILDRIALTVYHNSLIKVLLDKTAVPETIGYGKQP